ncbi:hypothetical protein [Desulfogranum japonicum]|uniref:hypothetical protein n=1 Tax=Desulfogranum japonicum TaxID=231447 RepID=UPI001969FD2A|nr:hypothetical protein [Desulfogranum japonicum]
MEVCRYIELNPVRAEMVTDPGEYAWSSYRTNALGVSSNVCTSHPEYLALGKTAKKRKKAYLDVFRNHLGDDLVEDIRSMTNKGLALGNSRFKGEIEALTGRRVIAKKRGGCKITQREHLNLL